MTVHIGEPPEPSHEEHPEPATPVIDDAQPARHVVASDAPDMSEICPYLTSANGAWRSVSPHRDHRCGAVDPASPLTTEKQRRLCLSPEHASCATFRAARASRAAMLAPGVDPAAVAAADAARRPLARSSALILEHPRLSAPTARWPFDRAMSQVVLVALMVVAFLAVAIARFGGPGAAAVAPPAVSASPTASAPARPTSRPTPQPSPSPSSAGSPSAPASPSGAVEGVTATPTASPPPSAGRTYVVKKGDNLYGIALTYGTTVAEIKRLNGLTDNALKIGQSLKLP